VIEMVKVTSEDKAYQAIVKAMKNQHPVTISYADADGNLSVRTIEIYSVNRSKAGNRYFKAMDRQTGESRSWRLDRISAYTIHRTAYLVERPEPAAAPVTLIPVTAESAQYAVAPVTGRAAQDVRRALSRELVPAG
jgi:predicted DNA-binding transcriptional regulator YafY